MAKAQLNRKRTKRSERAKVTEEEKKESFEDSEDGLLVREEPPEKKRTRRTVRQTSLDAFNFTAKNNKHPTKSKRRNWASKAGKTRNDLVDEKYEKVQMEENDEEQNGSKEQQNVEEGGREEAKEEEEDEEEVKTQPKRRARSSRAKHTEPARSQRKSSRRKPKKQRGTDAEESSFASDPSDDGDMQKEEEVDVVSKSKSRRSKRKSARKPTKTTKSKKQSRKSKKRQDGGSFIANSKEEDHFGSEEKKENEEPLLEPSSASVGTRRSRRSAAKKRSSLQEVDSDADADPKDSPIQEDKGMYQTPEKKAPTRTPRTRTSRRKQLFSRKESESESEVETPMSSRSRSTPQRASASRAVRKLTSVEEDYDDSEGEDEVLQRIQEQTEADDEEFQADEEDDDEDEGSVEDGYVEDFAHDDDSLDNRRVGNVDDDDFLDADESDDDDGSGQQTTPTRTPLNIKYRRRKTGETDLEAEAIDFSTEVSPTPKFAVPHMPYCMSTTDVITMDKLPVKHVCFVAPDGRSKQCFALETLHKIALSGERVFNEEGKPTFKQPPHFRSIASDDLLDQIASRFGRNALDLQGEFYHRKRTATTSGPSDEDEEEQEEEEDYMVNFDGTLTNDETFFERLSRFMNQYMGSKDIYCCPICYTEAYRKLANDDCFNTEEVNESSDKFLRFKYDPMRILGSVDGDRYKVAAWFCFSKIVDLKAHLRRDHSLDPSELDGNALFSRFKIRDSDGLLQRFFDRSRGQSFQGNMQRYWFAGNNELFVYLWHLMERANLMRSRLVNPGEDENLEEANQAVEEAKEYWTSIQDRVPDLWERISSPYRKVTQEELDEFLADDNEVIEEEEEEGKEVVPHHLIDRKMRGEDVDTNPEDEIVAALRERKRRVNRRLGIYEEEDEDNEEENEEEGDEDEDEEDEATDSDDNGSGALDDSEEEEHPAGYYSETDQEEEDDWVASLKGKRKAKVRHKKRRNVKVIETPTSVKRLRKRKKSSPSRDTTEIKRPSSASKNKRVIEESDSD